MEFRRTSLSRVRERLFRGLICLVLGTTFPGAAEPPVILRVDPAKTHQTIAGFGVFGGYNQDWTQVMSPALASTLVDDLGITISRSAIPPQFEPKDISLEGLDHDVKNYNGHGREVSLAIDLCRTLHAHGVNKFLLTAWTPPPWMKNPGNHGHKELWCQDGSAGGYLLPENDDKYADYLVSYLRYFRQEVGIEAYALSPQNEPAFDEPYDSCVYTPEQYARLIAVIGRKFAKAGVTTKIVFPEDIGYHARVMDFIHHVLDDPATIPPAGIVAIHAYDTSGTKAESPSAQTWGEIGQAAAKHHLPFWMTETSGYKTDLEGALDLAQAMYVGLKFGDVSAWIFWQAAEGGGSGNPPGESALTGGMNGRNAPPKYFAAKQFFRYVRPGSIRVEAETGDESLLPLAFRDETRANLTLVIINRGSMDKEVSLEIAGRSPSRLTGHRTSHTENCAEIGIVRASDKITIPARSITTLQGDFL